LQVELAFLKKGPVVSSEELRNLVEPSNPDISILRQRELLGLFRSIYYYQPKEESRLNLTLMRLLDNQYTPTPYYGSPKMTLWFKTRGYGVNHKRVERLVRVIGPQAIILRLIPASLIGGTGSSLSFARRQD
jgi:putative transposase